MSTSIEDQWAEALWPSDQIPSLLQDYFVILGIHNVDILKLFQKRLFLTYLIQKGAFIALYEFVSASTNPDAEVKDDQTSLQL